MPRQGLSAMAAAMLAAALSACGAVGSATPPAPASPNPPFAWVISAGALPRLGEGLSRRLWNDPTATIIVGPHTRLPTPRRARVLLDARNLDEVRRDVAVAHARQAWGILLDLERWRYTPGAQQRHPVATARQAAALVHAAGMRLVAAPALDLFAGAVSPTAKALADRLYERLATVADAVEIQAQGLESQPARYQAFVAAAARQVRAGRRQTAVWIGISSNPPSGDPSLPTLVKALRLAAPYSHTVWLNLPQPGPACPHCHRPRPAIARALLRTLGI